MQIAHDDIAAALASFSEATAIRCICHRNPDGDAVGSLVGIAVLLEAQYPGVPVTLHCVDPAPATFSYLQRAGRMRSDLPTEAGDAVVFVDIAEPKLSEFHLTHPQLFDGSIPSVCFDHHPTNPRYATVNFIDPDAASSAEVIVAFADAAHWPISEEAATALLTGVYTDTGGLLHSNTTAGVYRTVARLLRAGARRHIIVQHVFRTAQVSTLKLWGRVLEKISLTDDGGAVSALTEEDFRASGADYSELTGAIDYVNAVPGMRFSLILSERDGKVKGSLRTLRDDVDVSAMAQKFQGGGHKKAAGFALPGKLTSEVRWKVVPADEKAEVGDH